MNNLIDQIEIGKDLLSMQHITKIYGNGFVANNDVNFTIKKGEIHGLVGENGAGKSTLMKVLFGQETADQGTIYLGGQPIHISNPLVALDYGIGMVHQHFMLVESLTVAENMVLGHEPTKGIRFDEKKAIEAVENVSTQYELPVNPKAVIRDLSVGYKQRVEILKMLLHGAKILLLDEPTAVLTPQETVALFEQLKLLKMKGYSIVFISHKLNEVKAICDRITVLRAGKSITTADVKDISEQEISNLMVGRQIDLNIDKTKATPKTSVLKVRDLSYENQFGHQVFKNINFDVRAKEILGVAGVEGNGQSELAAMLSGLLPIQKGSITVNDVSIENLPVEAIRKLGVSIINEDRMTISASVDQSIAENMVSDRYNQSPYKDKGLLNFKEIKKFVKAQVESFNIKAEGEDADVKTLSGGNIQKVVAAREFTSNPKLLIACQPTRGIDVGAADLIRRKMIALRDNQDTAVLLFSADLTELIAVSDSLVVMHEGEIVGYFNDASTVNEAVLGEYMLGLKKHDQSQLSEVMYEKK